MKKKTNHIILVIIIIVLGSFLYYFSGWNEESMFKVTIIENSKVIGTQSYELPKGVSKIQSIFNPDWLNLPTYMMSEVPINNKVPTTTVFTTKITNPFNEPVSLSEVIIYRNDELILEEPINAEVAAGAIYNFKSGEIDLKGIDAQRNSVKANFIFINAEGISATKTYQYDYLSLTPCVKNEDCSLTNSKCDFNNFAQFSKQYDEYFCAKPCGSHTDCVHGQICRSGVCGY